jgi:hypothetical protein
MWARARASIWRRRFASGAIALLGACAGWRIGLYTIGGYPTWTLLAARDEAKRLRRAIDGGADPVAEDREIDPDADQLTRDIMPLGKRLQALLGNELLRNLPFELDAVAALSGHGFHSLKAQLTLSKLTSTCPAPGAHSTQVAEVGNA